MDKLRLLLVALLVFASCGTDDGSTSYQPPRNSLDLQDPQLKVVILAIDGPRYSETFGEPTHAYTPHIWNELRPQGAILTNFRNYGQTKTIPGHSALLTGTWQDVANDGSERPDRPTVFEYYRQWYAAPATDAYLIAGKPKLQVCAWGTHPNYGSAYGATSDVGYASDLDVYDRLIAVLQSQQPHLVTACFSAVDVAGHSGVWSSYVDAISGADSLVWKTWDYLQSDPFYAGQTYLLVSNDHGRHTDQNGGFTSHGDNCVGCTRLIFLALGPDIRPDHASGAIFTQRDLCRTVGQILQFPTPHADGTVIHDIFQLAPTGIKQ